MPQTRRLIQTTRQTGKLKHFQLVENNKETQVDLYRSPKLLPSANMQASLIHYNCSKNVTHSNNYALKFTPFVVHLVCSCSQSVLILVKEGGLTVTYVCTTMDPGFGRSGQKQQL